MLGTSRSVSGLILYDVISRAKAHYEKNLLSRFEKQSKKGNDKNSIEASKWLLENRYSYGNKYDEGVTKALNRMISLMKKTLPEQQFTLVIDAILNDDKLGNFEIDKDLYVSGKDDIEL